MLASSNRVRWKPFAPTQQNPVSPCQGTSDPPEEVKLQTQPSVITLCRFLIEQLVGFKLQCNKGERA